MTNEAQELRYQQALKTAAIARDMCWEYAQRIDDLQAENNRLRAIVPDIETREAIHQMARDIEQIDGDYYAGCEPDIAKVRAWLDKLDNEIASLIAKAHQAMKDKLEGGAYND